MKLGCASFFFPDERYSHKLKQALSLGYEGIEVRLEENPDLEQQVAEIEAAFDGNPVRPCNVVLRSPAYRASLDSEDAKRAKLASARVALQIAGRLGTSTIVQPEYQPQIPMPAFDALRKPSPAEKELLISFLSEAADFAEKVSSVALLEPLNRYESHYAHRLEELVEICDQLGSSRIKICADIFHLNLEEKNITESIENAKGYIHYVQLGDSNRMLPGNGHIDFQAFFATLKRIGYDGYLSLECQKPDNYEFELAKCAQFLSSCLQ